jgi:hypothetical protein
MRKSKIKFDNEPMAVKDARRILGCKAKKGLMFITTCVNGKWGWINSSYPVKVYVGIS